MRRLEGKVAIITGGGSGYGRGASELFAAEGAKVVVVDIADDVGREVVDAIKGAGGEATYVHADIADDAGAASMIADTVSAYGKVDVLYNNAGILGTRGVPLGDFDDAVAEQLIRVNLMGTYYPCKHAVREMAGSGGGAIITTASESAFQGNTGFSMYSATKAGVLAFTRVIAMEYAGQGIRANTVSPGAGRTPMHADLLGPDRESDLFEQVESMIPMQRAAEPIDIAKAALFLASDDSAYITGANLMVDGGWTARGYF